MTTTSSDPKGSFAYPRNQEVMRWAMRYSPYASYGRLVHMTLGWMSDGDGTAIAANGTIAEKCRISRRTVIRWIHRLEADGFITVNRGTPGFPNTYRFLRPDVEPGWDDATEAELGVDW